MDEAHIALCRYRLEKAEKCLKTAENNILIDDYQSAANRMYYAVYHALRSVIALDGVEFKKHSGNISYFRQNYIKEGLFDAKLSEIISVASEARNSSDYEDFYVISKADVEEQLENAKLFYEDVAGYLKERLESEE